MAGSFRFLKTAILLHLFFFGLVFVKTAFPQAARNLPLFRTSDSCIACHNGLVTSAGEDVSIGLQWRASMMANAARDPYWHAAVRREVIDHPEAKEAIEHECAACHMPMSRFEAKTAGNKGSVFAHLPIIQKNTPANLLASDGVSCSLCHQIEATNLGEPSSFTGGYLVDTSRNLVSRKIFGPYAVDAGRTTIMRSATNFVPAEASHIQTSEVCATCHTLITHAFGSRGKVVGELPEQIPYQEWLLSDFKDVQSCQSCHMPAIREPVAITSVLGEPRTEVSRHVFTGGNFFVLRMMDRYRTDLGIVALSQELQAAALRTEAFIKNSTAKILIQNAELSDKNLRVDISIENLAGHKFPTAYPSRRAWLQLEVRDSQGKLIFESGALTEQGMIRGNDNDLDPARFEPHYREIDSREKVQIYESIMTNSDGVITTGLLSGVQFLKDNRILPVGFDKGEAGADTAVRGEAAEDPDFNNGADRVRYIIDISAYKAPFHIEAKLWYQPIAFRWAQNLREYNAAETQQFASYYESMAGESAIAIAKATAEVP